MKKRTLKILFLGLGLVVLTILAVAYWNREKISIMIINRQVQGTSEEIPDTGPKADLPLTTGKADWICWRGPKGDGRSTVKGIRTNWSGGLKMKWQVGYLCQGEESATWSAPVIRGNRLVVCGRSDSSDLVFCLNPQDGTLIWKTSYPTEADSGYGKGARATPWIDNERVYTFGRSGDLVCWNLKDGTKIWHKNAKDEGGAENTWGYATSPLVTKKLVIVNGGGTARTIGYDKMTGKVVWKSGTGLAGYSAFRTMNLGGTPTVLTFHGKGLAALALKDGKELWNTPWKTSYDVNASTPVIKGNLVFITSGYSTGGELLKVSKAGVKVLWRNRSIASHHSDPIIIDDHIYGYSGYSTQNQGTFKCLDLKTGKEKWATKEMGWGTFVWVESHLLCMDIKGNLFLMKPNPERFIKVAAMKKALGKVDGAVWTVPVLANGRLYLRFNQKLVCYEISGKGN